MRWRSSGTTRRAQEPTRTWRGLLAGVALIVGGTLLLAYGFEVHFCEFDLTCSEDQAGGGALRRAAFAGGLVVLVLAPFVTAWLSGHPHFVLAGFGALAAFALVVAVWLAFTDRYAIGRNALAVGAACLVAVPTPSPAAVLARLAAILAAASIAFAVAGDDLGLRPAALVLLVPLAVGSADVALARATRSSA
jgi:hypothetical protein